MGAFSSVNLDSLVGIPLTIGGGYSFFEPTRTYDIEKDDDEYTITYVEQKQYFGGFDDLNFGEDAGVFGKGLVNGFVTLDLDPLTLSAETLFNTNKKHSEYDIYYAVSAGYQVNDTLSFGVTGKFLHDLGNEKDETGDDNKLAASAGAEFDVGLTFGKNEFSAGIVYESCDGDKFWKFPISWVHSF